MITVLPRATLVVPADRLPLLEKAARINADGVLLDLEDGVAPDAKAAARSSLGAAVAHLAGRHVAVRVNPLDSPWGEADLHAVAGLAARPAAVVIPKVDDPHTIVRSDAVLNASWRDPIALHALIETALGLSRLTEISRSAEALAALVIGYVDLTASLGRPAEAATAIESWAGIQDAVVVAARAAGLGAIDGPLVDLDDDDLLQRACHGARGRGFDGKWAIHPVQVATITRAFTPGDAEVAQARAVLEAFEDAAALGRGSARVGSLMIDEAVRKGALRTLARAGEPA
jgi:citrate lyase subunit beta/citryl-CoA lyase